MRKYVMMYILIFLLFGSCSVNRFVVKHDLLEKSMNSIVKLVNENQVKKVAICNFVNEKGKKDKYSDQFYNELYLAFTRRYSSTYNIVRKDEIQHILKNIASNNEGSLTAYEITALFDRIPELDGICTGFVGINNYYVTLFTPKDMYDDDSRGSKLTDSDWQVEISKLLNKMATKVKIDTVQPICISAFENFSQYRTNALGKFLSYKIYTELHKKHQLEIVHRDDLPKLIEEYKLSQFGFTNPEDALEFGKITGAKSILIGKTSGDMNRSWYLNLSLVDLVTGKTLWTDDYVKLGSDFFDSFNVVAIDQIDFTNLSKFHKKVILELINSRDDKSSLNALKNAMMYMIMENSVSQDKTLTFTKGVIDSLLNHQRYRMYEIDRNYIELLKKQKKLQDSLSK